MNFRLSFGDLEKHEVLVTYSKTLRLMRVTIDGQTVYRRCGFLPWARRRADEFRTSGREMHNLIVEPPGSPTQSRFEPVGYRIWLDGSPVLRVVSQ